MRLEAGEGVLPESGNGGRPAEPSWVLHGGPTGVERRDLPSDLPQRLIDRRPGGDEGREPPLRRQAAHHHQVVAERAVRAGDVGDAEVDIGGEPAVESDLLGAGSLTGSRAAEVEERQIHRLLELVDAVREEEDHRSVRLDKTRT